MIFLHLQYLIMLVLLSIGIYLVSQKYFNYFMLRSEDYYLLLALVFIFLSYFLQYLLIIHGEYTSHVVYMSHSFKVLGFWGFCSFLIAQIPFENPKQYRILKVSLFLIFILPLITILSVPCITNMEVYSLVNLNHQVTILTNIQSDIIIELMCFLSSLMILFLIKHFSHMKQKILYSSTTVIATSYLLSLFNLVRFKGLSYPLYLASYILAFISIVLMLIVIVYYYNTEKKKYEESNKRLLKIQKSYHTFTIDKDY